ncbi:hypothetical protein T08_765 [Trichinella sp. T8]|nr:hypothetical protein T08_765 [Trichinella sp. T8]
MDKPYTVTILKKSQATEPALAVCFDQAAIFARFNTIAAQILADNIFTFDYPQLLRNASTLLYCVIHDSPFIIYYVKYSYCATQLLKLCISEMLRSLKMVIKNVPFCKKCHTFYTNKIFPVLFVESQIPKKLA